MQAVASFQRWLFRLYGPEAAPIVLRQRRIYVLPTGAGLAYAVALGFMLIGAINYNLSLGYALVFLLAGLGLVTLLHTFRNLVQLEISPGRTEPVFAGMLPISACASSTAGRPGDPPSRCASPVATGSAPIWQPMRRPPSACRCPLPAAAGFVAAGSRWKRAIRSACCAPGATSSRTWSASSIRARRLRPRPCRCRQRVNWEDGSVA